jgi:hypothetical protein
MSWLSRLSGPKGPSEAFTLLKLRVTRFRQLLGTYGAYLALLDDAAEKQDGGFIFDRQYAVALAEQVAELTDAVVYDLNVITSQRNLAFFDVAERLRAELRGVVARRSAAPPPAGSEEEEYRLLRSVRLAAFPLTFATDPTEPSLADCRTPHDLVHLARSLAGDALCALVAAQPGSSGVLVRLDGASRCEAHAILLTGVSPTGSSGSIELADFPSRPLRAFLDGLTSQRGSGASPPPEGPPCTLHAAATDEHCLAVTTLQEGFDMLDATAGEGPETNVVSCRFAPFAENDRDGARGALASGVLARLGFSVTVTGHEVSGWLRGLACSETEERVRILGALSRRLAEVALGGFSRDEVEPNVEAFLHGCT